MYLSSVEREKPVASGGCPWRSYGDSQNPAVLAQVEKKSHGPGNQVSPQCPKSRKKRVFGAKIAWRSPPLIKRSFLDPFLTLKNTPHIGDPQNIDKIDKFIEKTVFFYRNLSIFIGNYRFLLKLIKTQSRDLRIIEIYKNYRNLSKFIEKNTPFMGFPRGYPRV